MKILYISHKNEESGYGRYCREFLSSLKETDHDISSFVLPLGKANRKYVDDTEKNDLSQPNVIIQNILPHMMSKGKAKCIGGAILESTNIDLNYWKSHLNLMDEIWYPHYELGLFENEQEVPTGLDLDQYTKKYKQPIINDLDGTYKFYWIGELSARKNLSGLIKAYYQTFSHSDPVSLIIKCHNETFDSEKVHNDCNELIAKIGHGCKLYNNIDDYPRIKIIPNYLENEEIYGLHQYGDCFVCTSHGESINYPMLDALGFNNHVLSAQNFATESYSRYGNITISYADDKEMCYGQINSFPWYQTSREEWYSLNIRDFSSKMRLKYENRVPTSNDLSSLSYKNVGKKIMEIL